MVKEFKSILTLVASMRHRRVDEKSNFFAYPTSVEKFIQTYEVKIPVPRSKKYT